MKPLSHYLPTMAARRLGMSRQAIYQRIASGEIPIEIFEGTKMIPVEWIDQEIARDGLKPLIHRKKIACHEEKILKAIEQERERIIQVLLHTDPVTLEDRSYQGNPFSGTMLVFLESALRSALEPK